MISLINGNALNIPLADRSVQCVVTSPPYYGLRDYGISDQIGLESTPAAYIANIVAVMRECWRVLKDDGVLWLNLGDSYAGGGGYYPDAPSNQAGSMQAKGNGSGQRNIKGLTRNVTGLKPKDLCGIPWRVAFALQDDGWYLRSDIIWSKPNPMPESVTDRPTKAHEYIFLLTKQARYYYDAEAIKEPNQYDPKSGWAKQRNDGINTNIYKAQRAPDRGSDSGFDNALHDASDLSGRNRRSVWTVATQPYSGAHFATFPPALIEPMILAGTSARGECPHCGKAWVRVVEKIESENPAGYNGSKFTNGKTAAAHPNTGNRSRYESVSTGWRPQCACAPHEPIPQTVLDPFCGSGTVGEVCRESLRSFVGVDLSLKYLHDNAMPRAMNTNTAASMGTLPMFEGML